MSTSTTLPHTTSSAGDHPKRTWHRTIGATIAGGRAVAWTAVAVSEQGTRGELRLQARATTASGALEALDREIAAFEEMAEAGGGR